MLLASCSDDMTLKVIWVSKGMHCLILDKALHRHTTLQTFIIWNITLDCLFSMTFLVSKLLFFHEILTYWGHGSYWETLWPIHQHPSSQSPANNVPGGLLASLWASPISTTYTVLPLVQQNESAEPFSVSCTVLAHTVTNASSRSGVWSRMYVSMTSKLTAKRYIPSSGAPQDQPPATQTRTSC